MKAALHLSLMPLLLTAAACGSGTFLDSLEPIDSLALELDEQNPTCLVEFQMDFMSARSPKYWSRTVQFFVKNLTDQDIVAPWAFAVHNEPFITWQASTNWIIDHSENGTLSGNALGKWQTLQANAANSMHLKGVLVSRVDTWDIDSIQVNHHECQISRIY